MNPLKDLSNNVLKHIKLFLAIPIFSISAAVFYLGIVNPINIKNEKTKQTLASISKNLNHELIQGNEAWIKNQKEVYEIYEDLFEEIRNKSDEYEKGKLSENDERDIKLCLERLDQAERFFEASKNKSILYLDQVEKLKNVLRANPSLVLDLGLNPRNVEEQLDYMDTNFFRLLTEAKECAEETEDLKKRLLEISGKN